MIVPFTQFEAKFNALVSEAKPFIAWFTSEKDPNQQGGSWCPDCNLAAPYLPQIVENAEKKGWKTYVFEVGPKQGYKNPAFIMRTHKLIKLKGIPTVAYFNGKIFSRRLVENEITDQKQRELLLQDQDDD